MTLGWKKERARLFADVAKLGEYLEPWRVDRRINVPAEVQERGRDGACLSIDTVAGTATLWSWMESGHNGDEYDRREEPMTYERERALLRVAYAYLFERAVEKTAHDERRELEREEAFRERVRLRAKTKRRVFGR